MRDGTVSARLTFITFSLFFFHFFFFLFFSEDSLVPYILRCLSQFRRCTRFSGDFVWAVARHTVISDRCFVLHCVPHSPYLFLFFFLSFSSLVYDHSFFSLFFLSLSLSFSLSLLFSSVSSLGYLCTFMVHRSNRFYDWRSLSRGRWTSGFYFLQAIHENRSRACNLLSRTSRIDS